MFQTLVHADWSCNPGGRWLARAERCVGGWRAEEPRPVPRLDRFVEELDEAGRLAPTLAGFDFPLGLPVHYGHRTGLTDFPSALARFGAGDWASFYDVASRPDQVSLYRPFYPSRPGGTERRHLFEGHGVDTAAPLTRVCERGGADRRAASCLFWTLGANQVGKATLVGWRDVVVPLRNRGARLWPFDGSLGALAAAGGLTLAETYPADVYAALGAGFHGRESKTRQGDRAGKAAALLGWAEAAGIGLAPELDRAIRDGFGAVDRGGDRFDAVVGLFGMIAVADGRRAAGVPASDDVRRWEGWILGRSG